MPWLCTISMRLQRVQTVLMRPYSRVRQTPAVSTGGRLRRPGPLGFTTMRRNLPTITILLHDDKLQRCSPPLTALIERLKLDSSAKKPGGMLKMCVSMCVFVCTEGLLAALPHISCPSAEEAEQADSPEAWQRCIVNNAWWHEPTDIVSCCSSQVCLCCLLSRKHHKDAKRDENTVCTGADAATAAYYIFIDILQVVRRCKISAWGRIWHIERYNLVQ